MLYRDHQPPHLHAVCGDHQIAVGILDGVVTGYFPPPKLRCVQEWRELHCEELLENWQRARRRVPLKPIAPLE
jgi:hypothetical protein